MGKLVMLGCGGGWKCSLKGVVRCDVFSETKKVARWHAATEKSGRERARAERSGKERAGAGESGQERGGAP